MRLRTCQSLAICWMVCCSTTLLAQQESRHEVLRSATDGTPIHITYYPVNPTDTVAGANGAPVVILLHSRDEQRLNWDKSSSSGANPPFPEKLAQSGYAVITVDLRKHGESVIKGREEPPGPLDYEQMVLGDLVAVKKFIYDEHQAQRLNMNKIGIIGVGMSVPVATAFAEFDWKQVPFDDAPTPEGRTPRGQDVRALVLISPEANVAKVNASKSLIYLRNPNFRIALMIVAGSGDSASQKTAEQLNKVFTATNRGATRIELLTPDSKDRGIALMRKDSRFAYSPILKFLDTNLKAVDSPWRDRKSRLED
ncbi:alpha/beta hydrolase [Planctomicrobium sp. SH664]|uniref:alpha/beta hydrolase n=1 Tax=Planctomicrobium sp. SH664 TaxID=3448125 RepID=UPI003F5B6CF4